jgi:hypothetical protein
MAGHTRRHEDFGARGTGLGGARRLDRQRKTGYMRCDEERKLMARCVQRQGNSQTCPEEGPQVLWRRRPEAPGYPQEDERPAHHSD